MGVEARKQRRQLTRATSVGSVGGASDARSLDRIGWRGQENDPTLPQHTR